MSQTTKILRHLVSRGSITGLEALKKHQCFRLAARIRGLREEGIDITTKYVKTRSGKRIARYVLERA